MQPDDVPWTGITLVVHLLAGVVAVMEEESFICAKSRRAEGFEYTLAALAGVCSKYLGARYERQKRPLMEELRVLKNHIYDRLSETRMELADEIPRAVWEKFDEYAFLDWTNPEHCKRVLKLEEFVRAEIKKLPDRASGAAHEYGTFSFGFPD